MSEDQWSWWHGALAGKPVDSEVGNPRSGFWKASQDEPIAIWRDNDGKVCCERTRFGGGANMPLDKLDELYSSASRYPIDEATYEAARAGNPPAGYATRLSLKEITAGVVWSLEIGRKRLGLDFNVNPEGGDALCKDQHTNPCDKASATDVRAGAAPEAADSPRAGIGHNMPPEPIEKASEAPSGHRMEGEQTPDKAMFAEVSALAASVKHWLGGIGGKPRNKPEADTLGDYATKFKALWTKAETARKNEKQPHLDASRDVDARWKRPAEDAEKSRTRCLEIANEWIDAENRAREAEARKANEEAAANAQRAARQYEAPIDPPPPVQAERVTSVGNMRSVSQRTRTVWQLDDPREYLRHLLSLNTDLPAEIVEAAGKVANRRAVEAPGVSKQTVKVAA